MAAYVHRDQMLLTRMMRVDYGYYIRNENDLHLLGESYRHCNNNAKED